MDLTFFRTKEERPANITYHFMLHTTESIWKIKNSTIKIDIIQQKSPTYTWQHRILSDTNMAHMFECVDLGDEIPEARYFRL
jgi:ribosomal protein L31